MPDKLTIAVHRPHQIGGCVTEITCGETRIFVDFGSNLPGSDAFGQELELRGLTYGESRCDGVFFTHMHGDHIGQIQRINRDIPLWMGVGTKRLEVLLLGHLSEKLGRETQDKQLVDEKLEAVLRANVFFPGKPVEVGDITVTPLLVDHSAFDAYMLLIEGGGKRVLHTGDFRTHGYLGPKLTQVLKKYVGQVDEIICEGTMMSRENEEVITEEQLSDKAREIMRVNRRVFVVCSSTNIARLEAFKSAVPDGRVITGDEFQVKVMRLITKHYAGFGGRYDFSEVRPARLRSREFRERMEEDGFLCFIRPNGFGRYMLDKYGEGAKIIYSQWSGYIDPENPAADKRLIDFLKDREVIRLHTGGHATKEAIKLLVDTVKPKHGVIPIHTDRPEAFEELCPGVTVKLTSPADILRSEGSAGSLERLRRASEDGLRERFGDEPPKFAARRLEEELAKIDERTASLLLMASDEAEKCREDGGTPRPMGRVSTLLTAYLLGLGGEDPLPAHYRCGKCRYAELGDAPVGPDLPDKACPVCGEKLEKSGFDMAPDKFFSPNVQRERIWLTVPESWYGKRGVLASSVDGLEVKLTRYSGCEALGELEKLTGVGQGDIPLDDREALAHLSSPELLETLKEPTVANPELLAAVAASRPESVSDLIKTKLEPRKTRSFMVERTVNLYRLAWYDLRFPGETRRVLAEDYYHPVDLTPPWISENPKA